MNYGRYWDLHLCSSTFNATSKANPRHKFFTHRGTEYRYDFLSDMRKQATYREGKQEGYESGSLWSRSNMQVLDSTEITHSQKTFLQLTPEGGISEELRRLRYVSCLVSIEQLKASLASGNPFVQLQSLVQWISDTSTINKLRINCHGGGRSNDGFLMGESLSPAELVQALVLHGLTRAPKVVQNIGGLAHAARWKRDSEAKACENPKCKQQFSFLRRRHHCRRCGGIFCENCSSHKVDLKVALAGESNKTVNNVKNARVCQRCWEDATSAAAARFAKRPEERSFLQGNETIYGLKQITLALCMGAQSEKGFSSEKGRVAHAIAPRAIDGFVAGSLAARLINELRQHQLVGIKVTGSNQIVSGGTGQIENQLGVRYPTDNLYSGHSRKDFRKQSDFDFPAKVWGSSQVLKNTWDAKAATAPGDLPSSSDVSLFSDNRSLAFGACAAGNTKALPWLLNNFLAKWSFDGWTQRRDKIYPAPVANSGSAHNTIVLTPPPRVTRVEVKDNGQHQTHVYLTGRAGADVFKDYKSYGVS